MKITYAAMVTLAGGMVLLWLAACDRADSDAGDPLDGTSWLLTAYGRSNPIPGTTITATFEGGQMRGSAGCNSYGGSYQVRRDKIKLDKMAVTLMACPEPEGILEQEQTFLSLVGDAQTFRLTDRQLQIFTSDGEALTFIPQE
ncbi:MAG: META domain-containing protein [Anaerolineales bacterium]|nr:MAG: META domain-containing protein [Anaerolineales bacterium]